MRPIAIALGCVLALGCKNERPDGGAASASSASPPAPPPPSAAPAAAASTAAPAPASAAPKASASAEAKAADPAKLKVKGKPIQGAVLLAKVDGKVKKIGFPGHKTTILEDGEFLIGFARTAPASEKLVLTLDDGSELEREFAVEQRKYEVDKIDGLKKSDVELDAATKKKVGKEEAKLDELRMKFGDGSCFKEPFKWPVKGKLSSRYGQPRVLNGTDAGPHWGVDIVAKVGTPVRAPACGKVVAVEKDVPLSGNLVILDHGRGLTSTFLHLDKIKVKVGEELKQGAEFATVGLTGRTNGAHLDWRMNLFDIRTDPELLAPPMEK